MNHNIDHNIDDNHDNNKYNNYNKDQLYPRNPPNDPIQINNSTEQKVQP